MDAVRPKRLAQLGVSEPASVRREPRALPASPRVRGEAAAKRRVRGLSAYSHLSSLRKQPLTPTLSPQERGEGEVGSHRCRYPENRAMP
jgi:hypothetical protein